MALACITMTAVIIILSMIFVKKYFNSILNPFMMTGAICFLVQVVGPFYWILEGKTEYNGVEIMAYMPQAELIFCFGYIVMCFVFIYSKPLLRNPHGIIYKKTKDFAIDFDPVVLYIISGVFFVLYAFYIVKKGRSLLSQLTLGQMGTYSEDVVSSEGLTILFLSIALNALITCATLLLMLKKNAVNIIIYVVAVLLTITSGKRHLMLDVVLGPFIAYYTAKKKQPKLIWILGGIIVCYLLVGWIGAMRSVYRHGTGTLTSFDSESAWEAIMTNLEVFMPLCMFIPEMNALSDFSLGTTYINAFLQLIPTAIFPFKSSIISSLTIGSSDKILSDFLAGGIAGTFWSGLYSNGWVIGVAIGMGFLGRWIKKKRLLPYTHRLTYIAEYAITTSFLFQLLTRSFGNALQDYIGLIIPVFILRRIYRRRKI